MQVYPRLDTCFRVPDCSKAPRNRTRECLTLPGPAQRGRSDFDPIFGTRLRVPDEFLALPGWLKLGGSNIQPVWAPDSKCPRAKWLRPAASWQTES
jgi:hypothetical protein